MNRFAVADSVRHAQKLWTLLVAHEMREDVGGGGQDREEAVLARRWSPFSNQEQIDCLSSALDQAARRSLVAGRQPLLPQDVVRLPRHSECLLLRA